MTREKYNELRTEVDHLENVEMPKIAEKIAEARAEGESEGECGVPRTA